MQRLVLAVAPAHALPPEEVASAARRHLEGGSLPVHAAVEAVSLVPCGSWGRESEAACMTDDGKFGAIAAVAGVPQPAKVALAVHGTPHNLVVGRGALALARVLGLEQAGTGGEGTPSSAAGVLVRDPRGAAVCAGLDAPVGPPGLVGATPLVGCAIMAGPAGAVLLAGPPVALAQAQLARGAYAELAGGRGPDEVVAWARREVPGLQAAAVAGPERHAVWAGDGWRAAAVEGHDAGNGLA